MKWWRRRRLAGLFAGKNWSVKFHQWCVPKMPFPARLGD